ncbi:glycosyltransferase family 10 domain-containing protein [Martelella radicis]|uniref:Fucosyltransferase C-terminal domain-containing protein n=1 Tax=Martelella radicis TaxID=1397476 RepID=A0A7W6KNG4_9HYPH|nr:glycosyltransferase family 10 [Martelella radicis]MBB4124395.1 hypothetical protein [Martelella radicis]
MVARVKIVSRSTSGKTQDNVARQLPEGFAEKNDIEFVFDADSTEYDWLAVYDDLPRSRQPTVEPLACPPANTILITSEPSGVKIYGRAFTRQFGHVLTSQEPFALRHPGRIWSQVGALWYYGSNWNENRYVTADEISHHFPEKTDTIGSVCSTKQQRHTLNGLRFAFTEYAMRQMPELKVFGHGRKLIDDKALSIDPFKYHLAVENHVAPNHITEKLSDAFLGLSLPFYFGAPNVLDYFPEQSVIPIDIRNPSEAVATMKAAIADNEYEKRLPAIIEARRLVIEEYNLFTMIAGIVNRHERPAYVPAVTEIKGQHAARKAAPISGMADLSFRAGLHLKNLIGNLRQPDWSNI